MIASSIAIRSSVGARGVKEVVEQCLWRCPEERFAKVRYLEGFTEKKQLIQGVKSLRRGGR